MTNTLCRFAILTRVTIAPSYFLTYYVDGYSTRLSSKVLNLSLNRKYLLFKWIVFKIIIIIIHWRRQRICVKRAWETKAPTPPSSRFRKRRGGGERRGAWGDTPSSQLRRLGSVVSSPGVVRGAENGFWCILSLKKIWWQISYFFLICWWGRLGPSSPLWLR